MRRDGSLRDIIDQLKPGMRVLLHAGPVECTALAEALRADPQRARGVTFVGLFLPGINAFDYASLTETTRVETLFVSPAMRASFDQGRLDFLPMHYSNFPAFLARHPADLAILHLPPPQHGLFSCGLAADIADGVQRFAKRVAVIVNPAIPSTRGATALTADEAAVMVEIDAPLPATGAVGDDDAVVTALAQRAAAFVEDGDTVQLGLGRLAAAVLRALPGRRRLRFHTGMIQDDAAFLFDTGAMAAPSADAPVLLTGIMVGSAGLPALAARPGVVFHGVDVTHNALRIAAVPRFIGINSAIEIDLFGNVNCEFMRGRQVSGIGGAADFARGARLSAGGRAIIALPSEARGKSRIVPCLAPGTTSLGRAEADIFVTEHGSAQVRHRGLDARAEAIIALAAPQHRAVLADAWRTLRKAV